MKGTRIVITGATGQVGYPVAVALAPANEVWAAARFTNSDARSRLEAAGVKCVTVDLAGRDAQAQLAAVPTDADHVLHFAVSRSNSFDRDLAENAEATGLLMQHCRDAHSFLHCSSSAVYQPKGHEPITETDPLGDNHRVMFETYSIVKIATEAVVRTAARAFDLPTVIARLNVPYGDNGGWPAWHVLMMQNGIEIPVHVDAPSLYDPIHEDDIIAAIPKLLGAATVPATIVNLSGDQAVSIEDWCGYIGELTGLEPKFNPTTATLESVHSDNTKRAAITGPTTVDWRDGIRRMLLARNPELVR